MSRFPSVFGGSHDSLFDEYDEFATEHLPEPGSFLSDQRVLAGSEHVAFHQLTREIFEERTVYDVSFNYNLARLNLDRRHPEAGYRYAEEREGPAVLRAEFSPTTPFCPQTETLTAGSFRAWNGLRDRHEYDLVRVRVDDMHHQSEAVNERLAALETEYRESGTVPGAVTNE